MCPRERLVWKFYITLFIFLNYEYMVQFDWENVCAYF